MKGGGGMERGEEARGASYKPVERGRTKGPHALFTTLAEIWATLSAF